MYISEIVHSQQLLKTPFMVYSGWSFFMSNDRYYVREIFLSRSEVGESPRLPPFKPLYMEAV